LKEEAYFTLAYASPAHTTRNLLYNASNALKLVTLLTPVKTPHSANPAEELTIPENAMPIMKQKDVCDASKTRLKKTQISTYPKRTFAFFILQQASNAQ
jgi:hypothetical protein